MIAMDGPLSRVMAIIKMAGCKCPLMVRGWCGDGVGSWVDSM